MSERSKRALRIAAAALLLAALAPVIASACPLCKEENPNAGPGMWRGMYWSILLMVAMPFATAGTIIALILRSRRRQAAALPPAKTPLPFPDSRGAQP